MNTQELRSVALFQGRGLAGWLGRVGLVVVGGLAGIGSADAALLTAGDVDNGASWTSPVDDAQPRPQFATWLANEINNRVYHGGQALEFDRVGNNQHFGHTFHVAPGTIDLSQPVCLTVKLFGSVGGNDAIGLQAYDGPTSPSSALTYPQMAYSSGLAAFNTLYGATSGEMTVDLRTIAPTRGISGPSIADTLNNLGHLDVWVADDSSVDYLRLKYTAVPEPSSVAASLMALCAAAAVGMRWRLG